MAAILIKHASTSGGPVACKPGVSWVAASLIATAVLFPTSGNAEPVTLEAALQAAEERSEILATQQAVSRTTRELAVAAEQLPDPVLKLSFDNFTLNGANRFSLSQEPMSMVSLGLMQTFTRAAKREALASQRREEGRQAEIEALISLAQIRRDTALAWFECFYRERMVALLQAQRDQDAALLAISQATDRSGQDQPADVIKTRSQLAFTDNLVAEAQARLRSANSMLRRWTGMAAPTPQGPLPALDSTPLNNVALDEALAMRPEHMLIASGEALAQTEAEIARQSRREDWTVELSLSQRGSPFDNMITLGFSRPLQLNQARKQDRELAARLALADKAQGIYEERLRDHVAEVESALALWRGNLDRLQIYGNSLIALAEQRTQAALGAYRGNVGTLDSVIEARREEISVRVEQLILELETASIWAQLQYLIPPEGSALHAAMSGGGK